MMSETIWFITGASRGFGRVWAEGALKRGDKVVATARSAAALAELSKRYGHAVQPLALDVTKRDQIEAAVAKAPTEGDLNMPQSVDNALPRSSRRREECGDRS